MSNLATTEEVAPLQMSDESRKVIKEALESLDEDNSGHLNREELGNALAFCGFNPTLEDVKFLADQFDKDGNGRIEIAELMDNLHVVNVHSVHGEELMQAFNTFDRNKDGYISFNELLKILTATGDNPLPVEEARRLIGDLKVFDKNHDGKFDYSEFQAICLAKGNPMERVKEKDEEETNTDKS